MGDLNLNNPGLNSLKQSKIHSSQKQKKRTVKDNTEISFQESETQTSNFALLQNNVKARIFRQ